MAEWDVTGYWFVYTLCISGILMICFFLINSSFFSLVFLTFYMFASCFRTLAVILVSSGNLELQQHPNRFGKGKG